MKMCHLSQILSKAGCKTTKQQTKPVSAVPENSVFSEHVRLHDSDHAPGQLGDQGRADGSMRAVCSPQAAVTHTAPQVHPLGARCASLQHLGSSSQTHPGTEWISQTMKLLCDNPQTKNPQQMVELNGPSSSAVHGGKCGSD